LASLGSAQGSGKTRVLTYRVAHLIAEERVAPSDILCITFTNKAASELKNRLVDLLPNGAHKYLTVRGCSFALPTLGLGKPHLESIARGRSKIGS
jgi:superfamily I DNA/RNA helicase